MNDGFELWRTLHPGVHQLHGCVKVLHIFTIHLQERSQLLEDVPNPWVHIPESKGQELRVKLGLYGELADSKHFPPGSNLTYFWLQRNTLRFLIILMRWGRHVGTSVCTFWFREWTDWGTGGNVLPDTALWYDWANCLISHFLTNTVSFSLLHYLCSLTLLLSLAMFNLLSTSCTLAPTLPRLLLPLLHLSLTPLSLPHVHILYFLPYFKLENRKTGDDRDTLVHFGWIEPLDYGGAKVLTAI